MAKTIVEKELVLSEILKIVEKLRESDPFLKERLDQNKLTQVLSQALDKVSIAELISLEEKELSKIVNRIVVRQAVAGTLDELNKEQSQICEAIVEGK